MRTSPERIFRTLREHGIKRIMAVFLIIVLSAVILASAPGLVILFRDQLLEEGHRWVMDTHKILVILDLVLWILITIELMDSIRIYIARHILHLETVLSLAMIALARKIITLKVGEGGYDAPVILGIAALVVAVAFAYFFVRKSHKECGMQGIHGFDEED